MSKFDDAITGLLGSPTFNLGVGLLAAGGRRRGPRISAGQGIAEAMDFAGSRMRQQNRLEAEREALKQQRQQRQAAKRLQSIMGRGLLSPQQISGNVQQSMGMSGMGAGLLNPQTANTVGQATNFWNNVQANQQAQIPGLLAQMNPQAFSQAAAQAQFSAPTQTLPNSAREFIYAQSLPPEQQQEYLASLGRTPSALEQAQLAQILANTKNLASERSLETAQLKQEIGTRVSGRKSAFDQIKSLVGTLGDVKGTAAETGRLAEFIGSGAGALSGLARIGGMKPQTLNFVEQKLSDLNKGFAALATGAIPQAFMGSDSRMNFYADRTPSIDIPLPTNVAMLRQMARDIYQDEINARPVMSELGIDGFADVEREYNEIMRMIDELEQQPNSNIPNPPPNYVRD